MPTLPLLTGVAILNSMYGSISPILHQLQFGKCITITIHYSMLHAMNIINPNMMKCVYLLVPQTLLLRIIVLLFLLRMDGVILITGVTIGVANARMLLEASNMIGYRKILLMKDKQL